MFPKVTFPQYSGIRCLMMPYIQGNLDSVPNEYHAYADILRSMYIKKGDIGYLTIDESIATKGKAHRGERAKTSRALHTEAGIINNVPEWGGGSPGWGGAPNVTLDEDVEILLANNVDDSCAIWNVRHRNTSSDGDIGYAAAMYPYSTAVLMKVGEVHKIGIFTPHESLPVKKTVKRQFLRILSSGVYGREPYFTQNPRRLGSKNHNIFHRSL